MKTAFITETKTETTNQGGGGKRGKSPGALKRVKFLDQIHVRALVTVRRSVLGDRETEKRYFRKTEDF